MKNPRSQELREEFPHEAELFDKYPRLYSDLKSTMYQVRLYIQLVVLGWILGTIASILYLITL